jgi:hypothetical protein
MPTVTVTVNGTKVIERSNVTSKRNKASERVGEGTFTARLIDEVRVTVSVHHHGTIWNGPNGKGETRISVRQLDGRTIGLEGHNPASTVILGLSGNEEPKLPEWGTR